MSLHVWERSSGAALKDIQSRAGSAAQMGIAAGASLSAASDSNWRFSFPLRGGAQSGRAANNVEGGEKKTKLTINICGYGISCFLTTAPEDLKPAVSERLYLIKK